MNESEKYEGVLVVANTIIGTIIAWEGGFGAIAMLKKGLDDPTFGTRTGWFLVFVHAAILALIIVAAVALKKRWRGWAALEGLALLIGVAIIGGYVFGPL